jgi:alkylhydroperoxidase/carboxymuconolactone decarboxylase family protein YurZ
MADRRRRYLRSNEYCARYFEVTHAEGGLDPKTKELMHLALVLAFHCEP